MTETLSLDPVHPRKVARQNSSSTSLPTINALVQIGSVRYCGKEIYEKCNAYYYLSTNSIGLFVLAF